MIKIKVKLSSRSYNIVVGKNALDKLEGFLKSNPANTPIFVVTNKKINSLHGKRLKKVLKRVSRQVYFCEVPDSEKAKSFPIYIKTVKTLAHFARKTKPLVIAFGGGVVGDLAGFVASAYRRGVPYVQIPTTLLAQVDSAIGGKVAIDIKEAKNIVGDFYQPKLVISDLNFLKTLGKSELQNGLSEVIKYGIIRDKELFAFLEKNVKKILKADPRIMEYVVSRCARIKARVVAKDEFDTKGLRAILNFGHTIGHAIETASKYKRITHGAAVARGMIVASDIAVNLRMLKEKDRKRIVSLIERASPNVKFKRIKGKDIIEALSYDKKFVSGVNRFILPNRIGSVKVVDRVPQKLILSVIKKGVLEL